MWDDHDKWVEELRQFLGDEADQLSDEDLMFVSNLAVQAMKGEISLPRAIDELHNWQRQQMGFLGYLSEEQFDLELQVNHPNLVDVTRAVKENLRFAEEPGIADGLIKVLADPHFADFNMESAVAMQTKKWLALERMSDAEHAAVGWAIAQAMRERNDSN